MIVAFTDHSVCVAISLVSISVVVPEVGTIVFMDDDHTLLDSETPP